MRSLRLSRLLRNATSPNRRLSAGRMMPQLNFPASWRSTACKLIPWICALMLVSRGVWAQTTFSVDSPDLQANMAIPLGHVFKGDGCAGDNHSPELWWHNPPAGTKSYAVTVFDIDAPGPGWWHWAVANLPGTLDHLPDNASASGVIARLGAIEARNDYGDDGYSGPCPPPGKPHRYLITIYALSGPDMHLSQGRPAPMYDHEIRISTVAEARLIVTYQR
jgi:Raf kinase inhibitor-like YbhB/YbcL family protein